jgi:ABC-type ATPase involved in cell division
MAERILHLLTAMNRLGHNVIVATHDVGLIAGTPARSYPLGERAYWSTRPVR